MAAYRWMLVNSQISTYVEIVYYGLLMAPISDPDPVVYSYCVGLLSKTFEPDVLFAIDVFLHCLIAASLMIALGHRYRLLCVFGKHWFHRLAFKWGPWVAIIDGYVVMPAIATFLVYYVHENDEVTRATILKMDPDHVFPGLVTSYGPTQKIFPVFLLILAIGNVSSCAFTVYDSNRILKENASSNRTAKLHRDAIKSVILQMCLTEAGSVFGGFAIGIGVLLHPLVTHNDEGYTYIRISTYSNAICYSLKSIGCSLAIILVHKPYRVAVLKMIRKERVNPIMVPRPDHSLPPNNNAV